MIVVSVTLKASQNDSIEMQNSSTELINLLEELDSVLLEKHRSGLYIRRDVHIYQGKKVFIAKRNQSRLWTRAAALRDADEIYAEIMNSWGNREWS